MLVCGNANCTTTVNSFILTDVIVGEDNPSYRRRADRVATS
jgi:hypothetical protein